MKCSILVYTEINPTEDPKKVVKAITNLFPSGELERETSKVTLKGNFSSLLNLKEMLEKRKIRSTARSLMQTNEDKIEFLLSKQAGLVNVVNFVEDESPLGDIKVEINTKDVQSLLNWLVPVSEEQSP